MICQTVATLYLIMPCRCEMLYILDQRLKAQSIAEDKSCRVSRNGPWRPMQSVM